VIGSAGPRFTSYSRIAAANLFSIFEIFRIFYILLVLLVKIVIRLQC
jgi:hypothetical protein